MEPEQPRIEYPRRWEFTLFGRDEAELRAAVEAVLAGRQYDLRFSRRSARGSYLSMSLEVEVRDEEERNRTFRRLERQDAVLHVL